MNEIIRGILERRSIRAYEARPVPDELLELLVKCGRYAPSGLDRQPWHFTVVKDRVLMDRISAATQAVMLRSDSEVLRQKAAAPDYDCWRHAPMAIVVSGDGSDGAAGDCANATENMALAAHALGLGACYQGSFKAGLLAPGNEALLAELQLPAGYTPLYALAVGYAAEHPEPTPRKEHCVNYVG
jgi:nitroreductase